MTLEAREVAWQRGEALVVDGVTLRPTPGTTIGLLGPNGSGKSSLLRLLNGTARPSSGVVTLDGAELGSRSRRDVARAVAVVSQHADTDTDIRVRDVVRLGRIPHRGSSARPRPTTRWPSRSSRAHQADRQGRQALAHPVRW